MNKENFQKIIVSNNLELSDEIILYIPGIGVKPEDLSETIDLFKRKGKNLNIFDFESFLEIKKNNPQNVFDEINSIIPEGGKIDYLIGYSLGGGIAFDYVKKYSNNVDNLILIDPYVIKSNNYITLFFNRILDTIRFPKNKDSKVKDGLSFLKKYSKRLDYIWKEFSLIRKFNLSNNQTIVKNKTYFLWGVEDLTCPIESYNLVKDNFVENTLIEIDNNDHDWNSDIKLFEKYMEKTGIFD